MSIPNDITVRCPGCGEEFPARIFQSINSDYAPDVAEQIISGSLFRAPCPHCGFAVRLEYDVLYNDMVHGAMIWVLHPESGDYRQNLEEIRSTDFIPYPVMRFVPDMETLREKVSCVEAERDDRVIELCKLFYEDALREQDPSMKLTAVRFRYENGQELMLFVTGDDTLCCPLDPAVYDEMNEKVENLSVREKILGPAAGDDCPFLTIDREWALRSR